MRPGRRAERHCELGLTPQFGRKSVRAANDEYCMCGPVVAPAPEIPCEYGRIDILAALVHGHDDRLVGNMRRERSGLFGHAGRGIARAAFGNFVNREFAEAELAADL